MLMLHTAVAGLLLSLGQNLASAQIKQYFIREPDNQTAIEGEQVVALMDS